MFLSGEADAKEPVIIYTDGACLGNPGPAGLGVVLRSGNRRREIKESLGWSTNNVAELTAILRALEAVKDRNRPVKVHSDSTYAIGVVSKGWKAKANKELVARIRELAATFPNLEFVKVPGHAGVPDNERCDQLAKEAAEESF
jgi:ribonuclease HI